MSFEEYVTDLNNLSKSLIQVENLKQFIQKYKIRGIVGGGLLATKDKDVYNKTEKVIKEWIKNDKLYELFLFSNDKDDQEVVKQLMLHPQTHMRAIVAQCIDFHAYEIGLVLEANTNNNLYQTYLLVLIHLLADKETEVALKILIALKKMMKMENNIAFMEDNHWISKVKEGIESADEVVALRFMELVVGMSNVNERIHKKIVETGLLDRAIQIYQTDDILVKLNAVEIFSQFGEKEHNSKYLSEHKITKQIIQEAFNPKEELYIRKYSLLLVVKMISNSVMKMTPQLSKDIIAFIRQLIQSKSPEEISTAFEIISHLCIKQEGINLLISDRLVLKQFLTFSISTNVELRKKCINVFTHIFQTTLQNPKNKNVIYNILISFGKPNLANSIADYTNDPENMDEVQSSFKLIEENLFSPFEDIELDYMFMLYCKISNLFLKQIFQYDELCFQYIQTSRSVEYIASHHCKNKLIFDMKGKLRERLVNVCKTNQKSNKLYQIFLDNYYKAIQTKTTGNQEMQYESETV